MTSSAASFWEVIVEGGDDLCDAEYCAWKQLVCTFEVVVLLQRLIFLTMGHESLMMLLKKLKHKIAQVLVDLDPLIEVINVESQRVGQVFLQSKQVEGLRSTEQL